VGRQYALPACREETSRVYNLAPERMKVTNPELGFISANSWDTRRVRRAEHVLDPAQRH
jgi:hypothetical protein